jgi:hypothetical protein
VSIELVHCSGFLRLVVGEVFGVVLVGVGVVVVGGVCLCSQLLWSEV